MKTTLLVIGVLLLAVTSQGLASIPFGSATVDGDLSDWAGASWNQIDTVYDSSPVDITGGAWSARWTANKIYIAVKVQDTAHVFANSYTDWAVRDAVELYIHTTGSGGDYVGFQEPAQQWTVGMKAAADGTVWVNGGYKDPTYAPTASQFVAAGSISAGWLYYEAAITPFQYFGGRRGTSDVVSTLSLGDTIGVDVTAVSNDGVSANYDIPGYAGMKCSALNQSAIGGWSANYDRIAQHKLVPKPVATGCWLSTSAGGAAIPDDTVTVATGEEVTLYCFLDSEAIGNTFEMMIGYDRSNATTYGAGVPADAASGKLTLASSKADILASLPAAYGVFAAGGYADKGVVLNATAAEMANSSVGGKPYGFLARAAKTTTELPGGPTSGQVRCCSFTLKNNMIGTDSQYVVVSNLAGGNSFSTAWKHGTSLSEDSYVLRIVSGASNLPTVAATNKSILDAVVGTAASKYNWVLWGKVSNKADGSFTIDDGSGVLIKVLSSDNTVANGNFVSVKGSINVSTSPPTLTASQITKY